MVFRRGCQKPHIEAQPCSGADYSCCTIGLLHVWHNLYFGSQFRSGGFLGSSTPCLDATGLCLSSLAWRGKRGRCINIQVKKTSGEKSEWRLSVAAAQYLQGRNKSNCTFRWPVNQIQAMGIAANNGRDPALIYATSGLAAKTNLIDSLLSISTKIPGTFIHCTMHILYTINKMKKPADYFNKSSRKCDDLYKGSEESKMLMVRVGSRRGDWVV